MQVIQSGNAIVLKGAEEFEPKNIFENGQCFRWTKEEDGSYTVVAMKRVINVKKDGDEVIIDNCSIDDFNDMWHRYFDFDRDYFSLRKELSLVDDHLLAATEFAQGLRILRQDVFEMVISFIISANNQIPRIKKAVDFLSELCGEPIGVYRGKMRYAFPSVEAVANISDENLAAIKIGFRAPYIVKSARMILDGEVDLKSLDKLEYEEACKELVKLVGVGPKVADCILLFGNGRDIAFPVDTWVIKFMNEYYLEESDKNMNRIKKRGIEIFGEKAGFAQQYLFYYARSR
ncbi:DNA-3-methyladenine glycosylase family protein [Proteocatella sphenisci]|uniref:DNA-3-methyladenine glycosylase family protein n=1 Tax=Proteocatella sphenisci TaxID=181070 RepID=UPI000490D61D|nr:DNA glycosylase [Proteocatella sphenisci]